MKAKCLSTAVLLGVLSACGGGSSSPQSLDVVRPAGVSAVWSWSLPSYFVLPSVPADNPMSEAKFQLGRSLFYDTRLSVNGIQSCASCHVQAKAFTDGLPVSRGATSEFTHRNAQPLGNSAWHNSYTWGRPDVTALEQQMMIPLFAEHPVEMGLTTENQGAMLARLQGDPKLSALFSEAFSNEAAPLTLSNVINSIASFQRGMVTADSRYDRSLQGKEGLTQSESRGKEIFFGDTVKCASCHGGFNFNAASNDAARGSNHFQNTGLYNIDGLGGFPAPNRGVFEVTGKAEDMGKFRVASLRNVALTAPYMHDGSISTLEAVIDFYAAGGRVLTTGPYAGDGRLNPYKSALISGFSPSTQDKTDLIAFLNTLTDSAFIANPRLSNPNK